VANKKDLRLSAIVSRLNKKSWGSVAKEKKMM
jgi:hypothetical protein